MVGNRPANILQRLKPSPDGFGLSEDSARFGEVACFMQTPALLEELPELRHALEVEAEKLLDIGCDRPAYRSLGVIGM